MYIYSRYISINIATYLIIFFNFINSFYLFFYFLFFVFIINNNTNKERNKAFSFKFCKKLKF